METKNGRMRYKVSVRTHGRTHTIKVIREDGKTVSKSFDSEYLFLSMVMSNSYDADRWLKGLIELED